MATKIDYFTEILEMLKKDGTHPDMVSFLEDRIKKELSKKEKS
jgi:hypothetical protein